MNNKIVGFILTLLVFSSCLIYADSNPGYGIDQEFVDTTLGAAPLGIWESAGSNALIDSVFTINVTSIPDSITYYSQSDSTHYRIPNAAPDDEMDDSFTFSKLTIWMRDNIAIHGIHAQIHIPPGVYNFSDQIEMHSNISLKGAGSNLTELRFLIRADSTSTTMSEADCKKDAIFVNGSGTQPAQRIYNVGIEDLKIVRIREGLTAREVKANVGDHDDVGGITAYWGNNIAVRWATNMFPPDLLEDDQWPPLQNDCQFTTFNKTEGQEE